MEPLTREDLSDGETAVEQVAPRAGDWLWKPWYAKGWWISIALFWACSGVTALLDIRDFPPQGTYLDYIAIILHPQAALLILGFGYVRSMFAFQGSGPDVPKDDREFIEEQLFRRRRPLRFLTDPMDPRSPLNPLNRRHHRH